MVTSYFFAVTNPALHGSHTKTNVTLQFYCDFVRQV